MTKKIVQKRLLKYFIFVECLILESEVSFISIFLQSFLSHYKKFLLKKNLIMRVIMNFNDKSLAF